MSIKPITKQEAEQDFNRESLIEENYQKSLEEAIDAINTTIRVHWDNISKGLTAYTAPLVKCTQYRRLTEQIIKLYKENSFQVEMNLNTTVMMVRLVNFVSEEEYARLEAERDNESASLGMNVES